MFLIPIYTIKWVKLHYPTETFQKQSSSCVLKYLQYQSAFENVADRAIECPFKRCYYQNS